VRTADTKPATGHVADPEGILLRLKVKTKPFLCLNTPTMKVYEGLEAKIRALLIAAASHMQMTCQTQAPAILSRRKSVQNPLDTIRSPLIALSILLTPSAVLMFAFQLQNDLTQSKLCLQSLSTPNHVQHRNLLHFAILAILCDLHSHTSTSVVTSYPEFST
jgi:hypothetical protein